MISIRHVPALAVAVPRRRAAWFVALVLWLMVSLLGSRWLGAVHQTDHADPAYGTPGMSQSSSPDYAYGPHHSCAAFDAAALGDGFCMPSLLPPRREAAEPLPVSFFLLSQSRHTPCPFSSRAPPVA